MNHHFVGNNFLIRHIEAPTKFMNTSMLNDLCQYVSHTKPQIISLDDLWMPPQMNATYTKNQSLMLLFYACYSDAVLRRLCRNKPSLSGLL